MKTLDEQRENWEISVSMARNTIFSYMQSISLLAAVKCKETVDPTVAEPIIDKILNDAIENLHLDSKHHIQ